MNKPEAVSAGLPSSVRGPPAYSEAVPQQESGLPPPPPPGFVIAPAQQGPQMYDNGLHAGPGGANSFGQHQYAQYGVANGLNASTSRIIVSEMGPVSVRTFCPHCHAQVDTRVKSTVSNRAMFVGLMLALSGCILGCCLIPCCMERCKNKEHYCPNCQAFLGRYFTV